MIINKRLLPKSKSDQPTITSFFFTRAPPQYARAPPRTPPSPCFLTQGDHREYYDPKRRTKEEAHQSFGNEPRKHWVRSRRRRRDDQANIYAQLAINNNHGSGLSINNLKQIFMTLKNTAAAACAHIATQSWPSYSNNQTRRQKRRTSGKSRTSSGRPSWVSKIMLTSLK
jgi:hypothetical protein